MDGLICIHHHLYPSSIYHHHHLYTG
jgi:hypothetical protein